MELDRSAVELRGADELEHRGRCGDRQQGSSAAERDRHHGDPLALEEALGASIDVAIHDAPVVEAGVIEMLPYLREQSVSITAHRFGDVDSDFSELRV